MNKIKLSCWTIAPDGRLPADFPVDDLKDVDLFIAGISNGPRALQADPADFAACVNEASRRARTGLLITLPPDLLSLAPNWEQAFRTAASEQDRVFFYGNYAVRDSNGDQIHSTRNDIGDITEREDWGPVWAIRCEWLKELRGLDEKNRRAAFFDLLLKSWGYHRHLDLTDALATISAPSEDREADSRKQKLFFPGRGALGGFSYLFMDKEEERHTENVFYSFLKRENAWLEGARTAVPESPDSTTPLVSVVTPVYNRASFIGKAIQSLQANTLTDWEYLIVDNGSTDGTQEAVLQYAEHDKRIRLIENDQNMIALSLNLGVKQARGKYISQLDSDDEYLPHTLQSMTDALENNPTWGLAISYYELMDVDGNPLPEFGVIKHEQYNRNNILRRDGAGALRCWHRSVILEMGGFDEKELGHYGEDYDLVLKAGEKYEVGRVHQVCYRYRRHDDNTDVLRDPEMKIRNKTLARLKALTRRKLLNQS
jgi:GT2 family glycosyltransferase